MNSKKFYVCVCCAGHATAGGRRPLIGKCIRLFVATRLFPMSLTTDAFICTKCRIMYSKWMALPEFCHILRAINNNTERASVVMENANDKYDELEQCMDEGNSGGELLDDVSVETDSMDDESNDVNKEGSLSSDTESFDDSAVNGDHVKNDEITANEHYEVVSLLRWISSLCNLTLKMDTMGSDECLGQSDVKIPIEVAIFSRRWFFQI